MGDYAMVTDNDGNVCGLWIRDPQMAKRPSFLCMLLIKENISKDLQTLVLAEQFRIVPNTFDNAGGCFIMFSSELAPGEVSIDVSRNTSNETGCEKACQINKVHLFVEAPWLDETIDPADVRIDVPFEFIKFADQELNLGGKLSSYVQDNINSIKVTNLKKLKDGERQSFYSNQAESAKWETYFRSTEAGYRFSILAEYNLDE